MCPTIARSPNFEGYVVVSSWIMAHFVSESCETRWIDHLRMTHLNTVWRFLLVDDLWACMVLIIRWWEQILSAPSIWGWRIIDVICSCIILPWIFCHHTCFLVRRGHGLQQSCSNESISLYYDLELRKPAEIFRDVISCGSWSLFLSLKNDKKWWPVEYCVVLEQVQVLVVNHSSLMLLRFGLGTFFGPDSVNVQHLPCGFCLFHKPHCT